MSIVYLDDLAQSAWEILLKSKPGVYHSKLTYRCKQNEFAKIITSITKKPYIKLGNIRLMFFEKQMRKSILSSIKLDDSRGSVSEEDLARQALIEKITKIHSDL
jgi:dTDP-4-dehydrorhamnose reductase